MNRQPRSQTDVYDAIYQLVRAVPRGRVTTYGAIAAAIGARSGARLVGYVLGHCSGVRPRVPAHRVVNSVGLLTGRHHFHPPEKMRQLLEKEGVAVSGEKVVDFQRLFWDPIRDMNF